MLGVKEVLFKRNNRELVLSIENECKLLLGSCSVIINNNSIVYEYVITLFRIIDDWQNEYIDYSVIDGDTWELVITYLDGSRKEYVGKGCYPNNFGSLEKLNQKLIGEQYV